MDPISTDFNVSGSSDSLFGDPSSLVGPVQGPTLDELGLSDPAALTASTNGPSALGSFFSGLASDASALIGGYTASLTQQQQLARNAQLAANGYTVPLNAPGLNGAMPTSTILFFVVIAAVFFLLVK